MANVRVVKHEVIPQCGSFEVRFSDGRPSQYFYWEDLPGRRLSAKMSPASEAAFSRSSAFHCRMALLDSRCS